MKILVTAPYSPEALQQLNDYGEICYRPWKENNKGRANNTEEVKRLLRETKANALIIEHDIIQGDLFDEFKLAFLGVCRGTPSNVDLNAASRNGVPVLTTPARNAQAVVELVIAALISLLRRMREGSQWLAGGQWVSDTHESYLKFRGSELAGKTVGMVGFGAVGQRLAGILRHFPCRIQYYDPYLTRLPDGDFRACDLESLFRTSDIVSIHLPLNGTTTNMIDSHLIHSMKPSAIFVNSARAAVVEREALYGALLQKKIAGAVLDVFYSEPPDETDLKIANLPYVIATPHMAGNSFEVDEHHAKIMLESIRDLANKGVLAK